MKIHVCVIHLVTISLLYCNKYCKVSSENMSDFVEHLVMNIQRIHYDSHQNTRVSFLY